MCVNSHSFIITGTHTGGMEFLWIIHPTLLTLKYSPTVSECVMQQLITHIQGWSILVGILSMQLADRVVARVAQLRMWRRCAQWIAMFALKVQPIYTSSWCCLQMSQFGWITLLIWLTRQKTVTQNCQNPSQNGWESEICPLCEWAKKVWLQI